MANTSLGELTNAIMQDLSRYTEEVSVKIDTAVRECTDIAEEKIISDSPVRQEKYTPKSGIRYDKQHRKLNENLQPGAYKKGWIKVVKVYERGRTQGYVRNKTNYQLTHLLELGHKSRNGAMVAPIPHIVNNETIAREELDRRIDRILEGD